MVGVSGRATNNVAPNSPSDTATANPNPTTNARIVIGRSTSRHTRRGGAEHARRVAQARVDRSQRGHDGADHERDRHHRLRERHEHGLGPQVDRPPVERHEEPEPDRDRRRAERQHQQRVHRARRARPAATRSPPTRARRPPPRSPRRSPRTRASCAAPATPGRTACRSRRSSSAPGTRRTTNRHSTATTGPRARAAGRRAPHWFR